MIRRIEYMLDYGSDLDDCSRVRQAITYLGAAVEIRRTKNSRFRANSAQVLLDASMLPKCSRSETFRNPLLRTICELH